jgi:hypothetical protein
MNFAKLTCLKLILPACLALSLAGSLFAQESGSASVAAAGVNLAAVATPSSSYVSGDTSVDALNDGFTPRSSRRSARSRSRCIGGMTDRAFTCQKLAG